MLVSFFNKVAGLRLQDRYFPVNFVKFLRIPFFTEHLRWLFLQESGGFEFSLTITLVLQINRIRNCGNYKRILRSTVRTPFTLERV